MIDMQFAFDNILDGGMSSFCDSQWQGKFNYIKTIVIIILCLDIKKFKLCI